MSRPTAATSGSGVAGYFSFTNLSVYTASSRTYHFLSLLRPFNISNVATKNDNLQQTFLSLYTKSNQRDQDGTAVPSWSCSKAVYKPV
jgi:hypothetical protein